MKLLIVEDEMSLAEGLRFNLEAEGHNVVVAPDGATAAERIADDGYDVVVLDVMLPDVTGFDLVRRMRERNDHTPVLMLTALGRPEDVLKGFEAGTDDYLPKPFDLAVLLARINALQRRREWSRPERQSSVIETVNGRVIDFDNLQIINADETTRLTLMEAKLLRYLMDNEGRPVSRRSILEDVWQLQEDTDTRAIDNFVVRLRKLLGDDAAAPRFVRTVRGVGYKFIREGP